MSTEEVPTRFDGPVVIAISESDPGDMGELRTFTSDGVTYLTVPPTKAWCWAEDLAEMKATFDLRWKADMRAIKMWQAAHPERWAGPGTGLIWPDHADMVVWALGEIERLTTALAYHHDGKQGLACTVCEPPPLRRAPALGIKR